MKQIVPGQNGHEENRDIEGEEHPHWVARPVSVSGKKSSHLAYYTQSIPEAQSVRERRLVTGRHFPQCPGIISE